MFIRNMLILHWFVVVLAGCAAGPSAVSIDAANTTRQKDSGVIVGRTFSTRDPNGGLTLWIRNLDTGTVYPTAEGISGYTKSPYFAVVLPAGRYTLNGVWAYNGGVGPLSGQEHYFTVEAGRSIYIGSIVMSWEPPKNIREFGRPVSSKIYGKMRCPYADLGCNGGSQAASTNATAEKPHAIVLVFDQGPSILEDIKSRFPMLQNEVIESRPLQ